jgi:porin
MSSHLKKTLALGTCLALFSQGALAQTAAQTPSATPGQILYRDGIAITANYTGEAAANPTGGIRQGSDYAGQIYIGADFDLQKMLGLEGTSVHMALTQRHGRNLAADDIGNNTSVQEVFGTQNLHLAFFTIEQKLLHDRLDITLGRTVANITFLNSPLYCYFQSNSACGNPTFIFKDSNFTYFPASSWGGDAKYDLTKTLYVHAGGYEVSPVDKTFTSYGLNFSGQGDTGVVVPFELGYATNFTNDSRPRHYQIGGWYDDSAYGDPLLDANGQVAVLTGQPYARHHDRSGAFIRFDQMLTRPDPNSDRGLTLFGVAMTRISGQETENRFYEIGVLQMGTFPGRDQDDIGFVVNDQEFSNRALANVRAARTQAGGHGDIPSREIMMELTYGAQITKAVRLTPNLQYIINPDQMAEPSRTRNIPNAFVVGLKFTVDLSDLAGLSSPAS